MKKQDCREGMKVIFGRENGEKTLAKVMRCNPKRAKVKTLESRGGKAAGENWNVPYSVLKVAGMTDDKTAKLWKIVDAARSALDVGDDPRIRLKVALGILKEYEIII